VSAKRPWAWPLVPLYAAGLAVKDGLRAAGILRARRLAWPVVSVGSLSAGGAGKTPLVIALAELLRERGWSVDVLSRGYGREGLGVERVDPDAEGTARRFGDEPVLLARRLRVPVWVGADRFASGTRSEAQSRPSEAWTGHPAGTAAEVGAERGVHLLDDGFQHRGLARALDVVLVTAADMEDALLPAGNRRERLGALRRADVVVLREEERGRIEARVRRLMRADAAIWVVRRAANFPEAPDALGSSKGLVAFCAIARPENFVETLRTAGGRVVDSVAFPDHHFYDAEDMHQLTKVRQVCGGDAFVTTEKDAVKLTPELCAQLGAPLLVARLEAVFVNREDVLRQLEARLR
jgi:tetraacyldisaccharide 4'-kinase